MKRRSGKSGKQAKPRRREAETPKRGEAPMLRRTGQESELRRERDEALAASHRRS
jgi:hypothetical protein